MDCNTIKKVKGLFITVANDHLKTFFVLRTINNTYYSQE